jgi:hypothetical protein
MHNLAGTYTRQCRHDEAEVLLERCLEKRKTVLGEDHVDTNSTMCNLTSTYNDQGKNDEAEIFHKQCLDKLIRLLGENHQHTLAAMYNLANTLRDKGKYDEVKNRLGDISNLSLAKITDSIQAILKHTKPVTKPPNPTKEVETSVKDNTAKDSRSNSEKPTDLPMPDAKKKSITQTAVEKNVISTVNPNTPSNKSAKIREYLNGSELKKDILEDFKKDLRKSDNLIKSIDLCLEYWEAGENGKTYFSLYSKVKNDPNLKDSKLNSFLKTQQSLNSPKYTAQDKIKGLR